MASSSSSCPDAFTVAADGAAVADRNIPTIETMQENDEMKDEMSSIKSNDPLTDGEIYYEVVPGRDTSNCFQTCFWCCLKRKARVDVSYLV